MSSPWKKLLNKAIMVVAGKNDKGSKPATAGTVTESDKRKSADEGEASVLVQQAYREALGRNADESGLAAYLAMMTKEGKDYEWVVRDLQDSEEFDQRVSGASGAQRAGVLSNWRLYQDALQGRSAGKTSKGGYRLFLEGETPDEQYIKVRDIGNGEAIYMDAGNKYGTMGKLLGTKNAAKLVGAIPKEALRLADVTGLGSLGAMGRVSTLLGGRGAAEKADWNQNDLATIQGVGDTLAAFGNEAFNTLSASGAMSPVMQWLGPGIAASAAGLYEGQRQGYIDATGGKADWRKIGAAQISTAASGYGTALGETTGQWWVAPLAQTLGAGASGLALGDDKWSVGRDMLYTGAAGGVGGYFGQGKGGGWRETISYGADALAGYRGAKASGMSDGEALAAAVATIAGRAVKEKVTGTGVFAPKAATAAAPATVAPQTEEAPFAVDDAEAFLTGKPVAPKGSSAPTPNAAVSTPLVGKSPTASTDITTRAAQLKAEGQAKGLTLSDQYYYEAAGREITAANTDKKTAGFELKKLGGTLAVPALSIAAQWLLQEQQWKREDDAMAENKAVNDEIAAAYAAGGGGGGGGGGSSSPVTIGNVWL